ncbi:hypothetical protein K2P56_04955 [Patescibacteria group bacterium]|nr:hypothetical protein [Patescibacteria group bacterium]
MKFLSAVCVVILVLMPLSAVAHGAGAYYEATVGEYIADVGFSSPAPQVNESVIFDFQLRGINTTLISGSDTEYTDVWVRIESEEKTLLATGIYNAEFGGPRLSYVFPKEGEYTIFVRYENESGALAELSFPMTVVPTSEPRSYQDMLLNAVFLIVGAATGFFLARHLKK